MLDSRPGIRNFDPKKELDEYDTEDFITEPADLDKTYYKNRTLVVGHVPTTELGGEGKIVKKNNNVAHRLRVRQGRTAWNILPGQRLGDVCIIE